MDAITAEGLVKIYRSRKSEVRALDGLDLTVPEGTVLGLLGPNGAGKTATVRIFATLLRPDAGHATVAGFDVVHQADQLRSVIGLSVQFAAVDENLTGRENLFMLISAITAACRQLFGNPNPFVRAGSFPSEQPVLLSLIWIVVIVGVFAPLGVRRYRSMSR